MAWCATLSLGGRCDGLVGILPQRHQSRSLLIQVPRRCRFQSHHQGGLHECDDACNGGQRIAQILIERSQNARATYWARLSDLENALLQCGHTYGRSWVWVLTCLAARNSQRLQKLRPANQNPREPDENAKTYRFRCSNLLKRRPHVGIGHECDLLGYGPSSIKVALRARRTGPPRLSVRSPGLVVSVCWCMLSGW